MCIILGDWESDVLGFHIYMKGWGLVGGVSRWCVGC
jgi:hypothetical protein